MRGAFYKTFWKLGAFFIFTCLNIYFMLAPRPSPACKGVHLTTTDLNQLIDIHNFRFIINNYACNSSDLLLLVLVHTAPLHVQHRSVIRRTWAQHGENHRVLFLLGTVDSVQHQNLILDENQEYHDIVQGSFRDAYRNMTYKNAMGLKWATYFCPQARFIMKSDDDVFVNMPIVLDYISKITPPLRNNSLILCKPSTDGLIYRVKSSKWYVSEEEYPGTYYPPYCPGLVALYSPDVVLLLYGEVQRAKYFWVDDVHVTGTLAAKMNLNLTALGSLVLEGKRYDAVIAGNTTKIEEFLVGPSGLEPEFVEELWNVMHGSGVDMRLL